MTPSEALVATDREREDVTPREEVRPAQFCLAVLIDATEKRTAGILLGHYSKKASADAGDSFITGRDGV